jgi:hypothetical protein
MGKNMQDFIILKSMQKKLDYINKLNKEKEEERA